MKNKTKTIPRVQIWVYKAKSLLSGKTLIKIAEVNLEASSFKLKLIPKYIEINNFCLLFIYKKFLNDNDSGVHLVLHVLLYYICKHEDVDFSRKLRNLTATNVKIF